MQHFLMLVPHRYKREAYRGSEFAARVLASHGLKVVMKVSCRFCCLAGESVELTQVIRAITPFWTLVTFCMRLSRHSCTACLRTSRWPLLPGRPVFGPIKELTVTLPSSTPAEIMGMDHRIGYVREGEISRFWKQR
jgi:hypothetical protein